MPGVVGHLENSTTCSRVGRTAWRKVRVCSSCPQGLIQLCHNTTPKQFGIQISQNNLQRKLRFVLIECAWLQSQYIVKNIQSHGQEKKGRYRVKLTFSASPVRGEDRELNAELTSLTKPSCHKFYQRAQVNKNLSSAKVPGIGILSYLMFIVYS